MSDKDVRSPYLNTSKMYHDNTLVDNTLPNLLTLTNGVKYKDINLKKISKLKRINKILKFSIMFFFNDFKKNISVNDSILFTSNNTYFNDYMSKFVEYSITKNKIALYSLFNYIKEGYLAKLNEFSSSLKGIFEEINKTKKDFELEKKMFDDYFSKVTNLEIKIRELGFIYDNNIKEINKIKFIKDIIKDIIKLYENRDTKFDYDTFITKLSEHNHKVISKILMLLDPNYKPGNLELKIYNGITLKINNLTLKILSEKLNNYMIYMRQEFDKYLREKEKLLLEHSIQEKKLKEKLQSEIRAFNNDIEKDFIENIINKIYQLFIFDKFLLEKLHFKLRYIINDVLINNFIRADITTTDPTLTFKIFTEYMPKNIKEIDDKIKHINELIKSNKLHIDWKKDVIDYDMSIISLYMDFIKLFYEKRDYINIVSKISSDNFIIKIYKDSKYFILWVLINDLLIYFDEILTIVKYNIENNYDTGNDIIIKYINDNKETFEFTIKTQNINKSFYDLLKIFIIPRLTLINNIYDHDGELIKFSDTVTLNFIDYMFLP